METTFIMSNDIDYLGIRSEKYINSGVILFNLKKVREDRIINKIIDLINNKKISLHKDDQTLLNYLLYPKIGM
jgi:lipopolysaccharide biosynthesis glycosyltransferase